MYPLSKLQSNKIFMIFIQVGSREVDGELAGAAGADHGGGQQDDGGRQLWCSGSWSASVVRADPARQNRADVKTISERGGSEEHQEDSGQFEMRKDKMF